MFGFGKALDVLRGGDAVTRAAWRPEVFGSAKRLMLMDRNWVAAATHEPGQETRDTVFEAHFAFVSQGVDEDWVEPWAPTHADLLAEDWDYVPEPDDREPHGVQQAEHWPHPVPASMWCTVDAKRAKVNSIIWSAEAKPEQLGLNCGHWVAMPADWQAPA